VQRPAEPEGSGAHRERISLGVELFGRAGDRHRHLGLAVPVEDRRSHAGVADQRLFTVIGDTGLDDGFKLLQQQPRGGDRVPRDPR